MYEGKMIFRVVASVTNWGKVRNPQKTAADIRTENLDSSAAGSAEMRADRPQRSALRTEASCAHWYVAHIVWAVRCDCPNERRNPADQRPTKKKIQKENTGSVRFVSGNDRRQEIKNHKEQETEHVADSFESTRANRFRSSL